MTSLQFDTLRYARRLKEAGVPEAQADVQAELMAEAFGFYASNLLTRDHFAEVLDARFAEQDARIEARFLEQEAKFEARFLALEAKFEARSGKLESKIDLHTWMLGLITLVLVAIGLATLKVR